MEPLALWVLLGALGIAVVQSFRARALTQKTRKQNQEADRLRKEKDNILTSLDDKTREVIAERAINEGLVAVLKTRIVDLERTFTEKTKEFPWLATAFADLAELEARRAGDGLQFKKRPAIRASDEVRDAGRKRAAAERMARTLKYRIDFYEKLFPWLTEVSGEDVATLISAAQAAKSTPSYEDDSDPVRAWLSEDEFHALGSAQRNQRALERWCKSRKSKWEVGRDFERYIGYLYEQEGYRVEYFGAVMGLEDLGRDLIARTDGETLVIQCKYWAQDRQIHEKHVFQVFGSAVEAIVSKNSVRIGSQSELFKDFELLSQVKPLLITTTRLSDKAREFARTLRVGYKENVQVREYPMVKCNISRTNGAGLYHLPFDQQYDRTIVEPERGERYVSSAHEAERYDFRRAFRWKPATGD